MKKQHKALKVFALTLAVIAGFLLVINLIPPKKNVEDNPFLVKEGELPMIAAHRGGSVSYPENTLLAFYRAVESADVDVLEGDLYLTKDGHLVFHHNSYIDKTCNVNGDISRDEVSKLCEDKSKRHYIEDMTLAELQQYNFGYYFQDQEGRRIYQDTEDLVGQGLQIATVDQIFSLFYESHPELMFIVEIKDAQQRGQEACRVLAESLAKHPAYMDRVVIGTFHDEVEQELKTNYPQLLRGAPVGTAAKFVLTQYLGVNLFDNSDFACLQIPLSYELGIDIPLTSQSLVNRAHRRNVAVQYWTINDADDMRMLIEMGVDCIMTDDPLLMHQVLEEYRR